MTKKRGYYHLNEFANLDQLVRRAVLTFRASSLLARCKKFRIAWNRLRDMVFGFFDFVENSGTQSSSLSSVSVTASLVSDDISESLSANNLCNNSSSSMMHMCLSTCIHSTHHERRAVKMNSAYPTLSNIMHQRMRSCHPATNQKGVLNWGGYYAFRNLCGWIVPNGTSVEKGLKMFVPNWHRGTGGY